MPTTLTSKNIPDDVCLPREQLTFEAVREIQREAEALSIGSEHEVDARRELERVRDCNCSACGRAFASVAVRLGAKLLTADGKVLKAFAQHTVAFAAA